MCADRRQLAAVLLSDMVGYSAIMHRDERLALDLVREQEEIVRPIVSSFGGRVIKSTGDGFLMVFDNALDAVRCAIDIQERMQRRNEATSNEPIVLRIGVHLGDVVYRDGDVFGDAVNIVARIEPLSDHGGVCVSQQVYDQVHNKLDAMFESVDAPKLKNIQTPVHLYRIGMKSAREVFRSSSVSVPADVSRRLVVLPCTNISPDPNDEYFADGMTEELIVRLAHVAGLSVIARTTAMHYKNSLQTALQIGRDLRVGLVLECSVRKAGSHLRITAQLIDTASEEHLWSSRYDRELDDVFAIQDDISSQIAGAISAQVASLGGAVALSAAPARQDTTDMEAYTEFLHARKLLRERFSESTIRQAMVLFARAIERDPGFARARVGLAECLVWLASEGAVPFEESVLRARQELESVLDSDDALEEAHSVLAGLMLGADEASGAKREAMRAIELNASFSDPYRWLAQLEAGKGNIEESLRLLETAYSIDPLDMNVIAFLGRIYFYSGHTDRALEFWERNEPLLPFRINAQRAEHYLSRRDEQAAERCLGEMKRVRPGNIWLILFEGVLSAQRGDLDAAQRSLNALNLMAEQGHITINQVGFLHYALGDRDAFFACMDQALELHQLPLLELLYSPLYEGARTDPRYNDLIRRQFEQSS